MDDLSGLVGVVEELRARVMALEGALDARAEELAEFDPAGLGQGQDVFEDSLPEFPENMAVLVYDPEAAVPLKWVDVEEFECPEEEV